MNRLDVEQALAYFEPGVVKLHDPASGVMIGDAEQRLRSAFPPSFREFLWWHNGGEILDKKLLGIPPVDNRFDLVAWNQWERNKRASYWNQDYLVVAGDGFGNYFVAMLDRRGRDGEAPIAFVDGISLQVESWGGSNYWNFLWFLIGDLEHDYYPNGELIPSYVRKSLPRYPWPFDHEWIFRHDPQLKRWLDQ